MPGFIAHMGKVYDDAGHEITHQMGRDLFETWKDEERAATAAGDLVKVEEILLRGLALVIAADHARCQRRALEMLR